ncbi:MAG: hypothetical protein J6B34_01710 [Clostridia bacterium]|nr:hypothetical protein [Clostridia bacterium]
MFAKLFKYDFRSIRRTGIPALIVILIATIVGAIDITALIKFFESSSDSANASAGQILLVIFGFFLFAIVLIALTVSATAVQVMILVDFYKSLITDEGYLTFTLPVKAKDIIFSKTVNAILWSFLVTLATLASFAIILYCVDSSITSYEGSIIGEMFAIYGEVFNELSGGAGMTGMIIVTVIQAIVYAINSQLLYFLAIFIASVITRKNKGITAIALIIGVNFAYGTLTSIISTITGAITGVAGATGGNVIATMNITTIVLTILIAGLTVGFFFILKHLMENKLNLD